MSNSIKSNVILKGIALSVATFVAMLAVGFFGANEISNLNIALPITLDRLVAYGTLLVFALTIPMLKAGLNGSVKNAVALGSLPSFVLGLLFFAVI